MKNRREVSSEHFQTVSDAFMKFLRVHLPMLKTSFLFCLATLFIVTGAMFTNVAAQDDENTNDTVIKHNLPDFVPLKVELISELDSAGVLSNFKVKVTNTGKKPIYSLRFNLLTDIKVFGTPFSIWGIKYGRHELNSGADESEENNVKLTDKFINPNETITFKIPKHSLRVHKRNIETGFYPQPQVYELVFVDLMHGDDTGFFEGGIVQRRGTVPKKNFKDTELNSCPVPDLYKFFKAVDFPLIWLLSSEYKIFNFLQFGQIQSQNGQDAPACAEGCAFRHCQRVVQYTIGGCPLPLDPGVQEPHLYVNYVFNTTDCGNNCHNLRLITEACQTEGYTTRRYDVTPCNAIPPDPPDGCIHSGHGEAKLEGYEYECGDGIDNDCDTLIDCQEDRCRPTGYCSNACDLDGDQVQNPSCGGNDCDEQSIYKTSIPIKDENGNLTQESDLIDCDDGRDNDCDGKIDYDGKNGSPADDSCPIPTPTPTPEPTPEEDLCGLDSSSKINSQESFDNQIQSRPDPNCCNDFEAGLCIINGGVWIPSSCTCVSPIVIDVAGNGFNLTNAQNGVLFDITNDGVPKQVSWTSANSDDAWLALDRNGNGRIDNGGELFGSSTVQPYLAEGESKNGFRALALYDRLARGGNSDEQIDDRDAIFSQLKLWRDVNHNGVSEQNEMRGLAESNIRIIELRYHESKRQDENGNWFRYRAKVRDAQGAQVGRWAWDVFLKIQTP